MIKQPPYLKKGDKVAIVCPAKKLRKPIDAALALLEEWGLELVIGKSVYADYHQFAGDDELRTKDMQHFLDDPSIKAIIAGRGGYGTVRILDALDYSAFQQHPKWIVGFSDITALISHVLATQQTQSIHGQMPGSFEDGTEASLETLRKSLFGEELSYVFESVHPNRAGTAEGVLIGGNLSLLVALEGSVSAMDYQDKILFLEDVGEYEYAIDRLMYMLKRSGRLAGLKGLIIGAFNQIKPQEIPFGQTPEELIWDIVKEYGYPVAFNFPVGHIDDNQALVVGATVSLEVTAQAMKLRYL